MGLRIEVALLAGRYAAANPATGLGEFPPHPARCFAALTAAWAAQHPTDSTEADALRWLERQPAPTITARPVAWRGTVGHFVPVNDDTLTQSDRRGGFTAAMKLLPVERKRTPRDSCPSSRVDNDLIVFTYPTRPPSAVFAALERLAGRVTRVGSAESFAACRVLPGTSATPDWVPCDSHTAQRTAVRVCYRGMFDALAARHDSWMNGAERGPLPADQQFYAPTVPLPADASVEVSASFHNGGAWIALEVLGPGRHRGHLGAAAIGKALRSAVMSHASQPPHPVIHGHAPDGSPTRSAHAMWLTLPHVGGAHGDGTVKAVAVVLPAGCDDDAHAAVLASLQAWERSQPGRSLRLLLGAAGTIGVRLPADPAELSAAGRLSTWSGPARVWVSATPLALPARSAPKLASRTPSDRRTARSGLTSAVHKACINVGLPEPRQVVFSRAPLLRGAVHGADWPLYRGRWPVHAAVEFDEPVAGPVVVGDGRHVGLGLMRPTRSLPTLDQ